jgi:RNA polymerase primary sigma factor
VVAVVIGSRDMQWKQLSNRANRVPFWKNRILLSREEEKELLGIYYYSLKAGQEDLVAREKLVENNIGFIYHVVRKSFSGKRSLYNDFIGAGKIGLYLALKNFDFEKHPNISLRTYAEYWIYEECHAVLVNETSRGSGRVAYSALNKLEKARNYLQTSRGVECPSFEQLKEISGIRVEAIKDLWGFRRPTISLNRKTMAAEGETTKEIQDTLISPYSDFTITQEEISFKEKMKESIEMRLTKKELNVIRMRFGISPETETHTLEETGKKFNLTRERIRQIEARAFRKLRGDTEVFRKIADGYVLSK